MLKRTGIVFVVTLIALTAMLAAQENRGRSVPPTATATISPTDTARDAPPQQKPPQNEPMFGDPHNLPVPANIVGATLDPSAIGVSVKPTATVTYTLRDALARDAQHPEFARRKKTENEAMVNEPHNLPVPARVVGEPFRVTTPSTRPVLNTARLKQQLQGPQAEFPAIGDNNTVIPPDMGGAVGPNHVMTALNSQVRIQSRTGTTISTVTLNGFFSPLVGTANVFDPKLAYDIYAGRWIITAPANSNSAASALLLAVSATNDPTGTWTGYSFDVDAGNTKWFDYPSLGFNTNWIVVTGNIYSIGGNAFQGTQVYAFDRNSVYAGAPVTTLFNSTSNGATLCPAVTLDSTQTTEYLVNNWNGNSSGKGYLRIFTLTGTPAAPVFTATSLFPNVLAPWVEIPPGGADFAPQSGATQKIATNDSRMQNVVYQAGSLWCAHTVFLPTGTPTHSAAEWWQINPTNANVQQFGRIEDTTATFFYAFPTIAVNAYSDALLGFSSFAGSQFASAAYSFRLHTDAPSTMSAPVVFKAGLASYFKTFGGTHNRWGDYSSTTIDPDDFSLWTLQEYADAQVSGQSRWGTEWTQVTPPIPSLYMQDRIDDLGAEPNPTTLPMWESTDIWIRQNQDTTLSFAHVHENAEFRTGTSNPNFVYVDVRNRGGAASSGTETLTVYWAKASSGLGWPDPWNGGIFFDPGPNTMLMGDIIGTATIPSIPAAGHKILEFPWNPPNPAVYANAFGADQNHFCLLARITTGTTAPFGMTFPETSGFYGNVQNNNRIVWKNIAVYDLLPGIQAPAFTVLANLTRESMKVKVRFNGVNADGANRLFDNAVLNVTPVGVFKEVLKGVRITGDGVRDLGNGSFTVLKDGATAQGITLAPRQFGSLQVTLVPKDPAAKLPGYAVIATQLEDRGGPDLRIGGQTFVFGQVAGYRTESPKPKTCMLDDGLLAASNTFGRRVTLAQTFTPKNSGQLTRVIHGLQGPRSDGVTSYDLLITTTDAAGLPTWPAANGANVLFSAKGLTTFSTSGIVNGSVPIPADRQPQLTAGTRYALILVPGAPANGLMYWRGNSGASTYPNGSAFELNGSTWTVPTTGPKDHGFQMEGVCR